MVAGGDRIPRIFSAAVNAEHSLNKAGMSLLQKEDIPKDVFKKHASEMNLQVINTNYSGSKALMPEGFKNTLRYGGSQFWNFPSYNFEYQVGVAKEGAKAIGSKLYVLANIFAKGLKNPDFKGDLSKIAKRDRLLGTMVAGTLYFGYKFFPFAKNVEDVKDAIVSGTTGYTTEEAPKKSVLGSVLKKGAVSTLLDNDISQSANFGLNTYLPFDKKGKLDVARMSPALGTVKNVINLAKDSTLALGGKGEKTFSRAFIDFAQVESPAIKQLITPKSENSSDLIEARQLKFSKNSGYLGNIMYIKYTTNSAKAMSAANRELDKYRITTKYNKDLTDKELENKENMAAIKYWFGLGINKEKVDGAAKYLLAMKQNKKGSSEFWEAKKMFISSRNAIIKENRNYSKGNFEDQLLNKIIERATITKSNYNDLMEN
jgi:hypothetical protein